MISTESERAREDAPVAFFIARFRPLTERKPNQKTNAKKKRDEQVSAAVSAALTERADDFGIVLDDVAITHLSFGAEFTRAVEMKQVAEQDAERARFVVLKAEQERNAAVIRAEGESEAARLISDATRAAGPGLVELRRIEAARDIAETMARSPNVAYLPGGGSNMLLSLNAAR